MTLIAFEGTRPLVHESAWVAPTATVVGNVTIEAGASVWYGAVLRGDFGPIIVRKGANVQDGSVLHGGSDPYTEIGEGATVGHLCVVHAARIGEEALVGNGAVVLDGAIIGARSLVAAGSTVSPGTEIPPDTLAIGSPARAKGPLSETAKMWVSNNPAIYQELAQRHLHGTEVLL